AFDVLAQRGLPLVLDSKSDGNDVRVWVPGCGTGEEAYSLAMILHEYMTRRNIRFRVQVFGTDLDRQAIAVARKGFYPSGIANDVSHDRLKRYFTKEDSHYRVKKMIRDLVIFAPHNLLADPPFMKLDLLSCRNLLIYLEGRTQRRLFPLFHYTLKTPGVLFLASSEAIGEWEEGLCHVVDRKWRLYQRNPGAADRTYLEGFPGHGLKGVRYLPGEEDAGQHRPVPSITSLIENLLLQQ